MHECSMKLLFIFETTTYNEKPDKNIKFNPISNIFLEYSKKIINEEGLEVDAPPLDGIRGGTIWEVDESQFLKDGISSPAKTIKLVAIECSFEEVCPI